MSKILHENIVKKLNQDIDNNNIVKKLITKILTIIIIITITTTLITTLVVMTLTPVIRVINYFLIALVSAIKSLGCITCILILNYV